MTFPALKLSNSTIVHIWKVFCSKIRCPTSSARVLAHLSYHTTYPALKSSNSTIVHVWKVFCSKIRCPTSSARVLAHLSYIPGIKIKQFDNCTYLEGFLLENQVSN